MATNEVITIMGISEDIKQSSFDSAQEKVLINILYTNNWLSDHYKTLFAPYDIKSQHYNILRILKGKYPEASYPGDIKEVMLDKSPDLTRLIDKLIKMGLVDRNECKVNRRKVDIKITDKGIRLLADISKEMKEFTSNWQEKLNDEEADKLSELLDKLRE